MTNNYYKVNASFFFFDSYNAVSEAKAYANAVAERSRAVGKRPVIAAFKPTSRDVRVVGESNFVELEEMS